MIIVDTKVSGGEESSHNLIVVSDKLSQLPKSSLCSRLFVAASVATVATPSYCTVRRSYRYTTVASS